MTWRERSVTHVARLVILSLSLTYFGCMGDELPPSVWLTAQQGLDIITSPDLEHSAWGSNTISADIKLLHDLGAQRLRATETQEVVVIDERTQTLNLGVTVDSWPLSLEFLVKKKNTGWSVAEQTNRRSVRLALTLLSESGLPQIRKGLPWNGGLMGVDALGRPNASVLLLGDGVTVSVGGHAPRRFEKTELTASIQGEFERRARASTAAFATYRPHVAIALPMAAPFERLVQLVRSATQAGALSIQLLANSEDGPSWLPLAVVAKGAKQEQPAEVRITADSLAVRRATTQAFTPVGRELTEPTRLINALDVDARNGLPVRALLFEATKPLNYGDFVQWLGQLSNQRPDLKIALKGTAQ